MYEWLNSFQEWEQKTALLDWRLNVSQAELERWKDPSDLGRYALTKDSKASKLEEIIADLEHQLAIVMNELYDLKKVIYSFRGPEQHILRMKYIEGLTLQEIADEMGYSYRHTKRKHSELLKKVEFYQKLG